MAVCSKGLLVSLIIKIVLVILNFSCKNTSYNDNESSSFEESNAKEAGNKLIQKNSQIKIKNKKNTPAIVSGKQEKIEIDIRNKQLLDETSNIKQKDVKNSLVECEDVVTGPSYKRVSTGVNLAYECTNKKCKSRGDYVWIYKNLGLGHFNIVHVFEDGLLRCPCCNTKVDDGNILGVGFFNCYYSVRGSRVIDSKKLPKRKNKEIFILKEKKTKVNKIEKQFFNVIRFLCSLDIKTRPIH